MCKHRQRVLAALTEKQAPAGVIADRMEETDPDSGRVDIIHLLRDLQILEREGKAQRHDVSEWPFAEWSLKPNT